MPDLTEQLAEALNREGACCGQCGREPGDPLDDCPDCRRCFDRYTAAFAPVIERDRERYARLYAANELARAAQITYRAGDSSEGHSEDVTAALDDVAARLRTRVTALRKDTE